jgi:hypothetical protein
VVAVVWWEQYPGRVWWINLRCSRAMCLWAHSGAGWGPPKCVRYIRP